MDSNDVAEIKRHISVVVEDVQSKMKLIAEGVSALDNRMGRVEDSLGKVDGRLDRVETRLGHVDTRLEKIESRLSSVEDRLERGFAETQAMIKFSYAELDRRVSALEGVVADLASRVQKLEVQ